jgi:glycosyltransferase involved in cell wall biosynthesis
LTGEVTQEALALWMNAADVLCLASRREGCPNVVLEALACGLPVVANAVGAIPELLSTEEVGLLVPPGDGRALEQALRRALGKPWDREVVRRRAGVRSWEEVAVELREVFREAAGDFGENRK